MVLELTETDVHVLLLAANCGIPVNARPPKGNGDAELPLVFLSIGGEAVCRHR